ncbi:MAG: HAMP domain-containing sensor histidine kinase [Tepidisphaeraceae bacterium]|jgi:signal transduction histidine kinase
MSLWRKILFKDAVLFVSLLLMIAGSMFGLWRQREHVQASLNEYSALHLVEVAEARLLAFQQAVRSGAVNQPAAITDLRAALSAMTEYKAVLSQYDSILPPEITPDLQFLARTKTRSIVTGLAQLTMQVETPKSHGAAHPEGAAPPDPAAVSAAVDRLSGELMDLLATCNGFVHRTQLASDTDLRVTTIAVASIAGCTLVIALLASGWQYRKIVVPLQRLRRWCRLVASGDFSVGYQPTADREFQELARDVNKMADELSAFYRKLESMVALKSRELVRSERLASVGYLAAGVAHEINNPLNIMSGYAELSLKRLRRLSSDSMDAEVAKHLAIIRGEAFRCKEITQKLLSLAKGNGDVREIISLGDAVVEVSKLVRGLKTFRGKSLEISIDPQEKLLVRANLPEMKQVLLNLLINAIEAMEVGSGDVVVEGRRTGNWVELEVSDNGRGMSGETIERVFEPFFTNKRGADEPGTGLGLSISHAIVTDHGGEILVQSDGLNQGSRFTVRLPAAVPSLPPSIRQDTPPIAEPVV